MKYNLSSKKEKDKMKKIIKTIFQESDLDGDGCLNKEELEIACKNSTLLKQMIKKSITPMKEKEVAPDDLED